VPLNKRDVKNVVKRALKEDASASDITTIAFIPKNVAVQAQIVSKEDGVICGIGVVREVFKLFDRDLFFKKKKRDGQFAKAGETICVLKGRARSILSCERVALNFLSYLSGISSATYNAVRQVRSKGIQILDTRKTTPLFRSFEKYAVLTGGGKNHRFDLSCQYLLKDNHLTVLKKIRRLSSITHRSKKIPFEIEVESPRELKKILSINPDIVLLDNFSPKEVRKAVILIRKIYPYKNKRPLIELSGGITLHNIEKYAIMGVDFISLGALTHSAKALDVSLEITQCL